MKKQISKKIFLLFTAIVLVVGFFAAVFPAQVPAAQAASIAELRAQNNALQDQINANKAKAKELGDQANTLQNQLSALGLQISTLQDQINLTKGKIAELQASLEKAQSDLDKQKALLKASVQALYKKGGASTVELLVGSDSFSQFINDQTYLEKLKTGIQDSATKVIELKQQIQKQQVEQLELLSQQKTQQESLQTTQSQQQNLLDQTKGQEAAYQQVVSNQRAQQEQVLADIAAKLATSGTQQYPGDGTNGGYPVIWAHSAQDSMVDSWGMYNRECVSYVAFKVAQSGRNMPYWGGVGNANQWPDNARAAGIAVDRNPRVGDVAITYIGGFGHAMYVEAINVDGDARKVYVSQYNLTHGQYSEMAVNADSSYVGQMVFIHFP